MPVLTAIDLTGIQRYVFASNRLRDAVAASWLVQWATSRDGALARSGGHVLLAAGGNALLRFEKLADAKAFTTLYTRALYERAPGLEAVVVHQQYENGALASALKKLQAATARAKLAKTPSAPHLGISVTAQCQVTGLAAAGFEPGDPKTPLSREVLTWRSKRDEATKHWRKYLAGPNSRFEFPKDLDDLGRTRGDTSLIGVVHVDGNGVGSKIAEWLNVCIESNKDDASVTAELQEFSDSIDQRGARALEAVIRRVADAVVDEKGDLIVRGAMPRLEFKLESGNAKETYLPIRPILLGGDDLTFLCDGRLALDLAVCALDAFAGEIPHLGRITACAGVALIRSHYPFDRGYELAESLCKSAKHQRLQDGDAGAWLDWHVGATRPGEGIEVLRRRAYSDADQKRRLTCRPYRVGTPAKEEGSWRWLSSDLLDNDETGFRGMNWLDHRNKLKELASVVRDGPTAFDEVRKSWTVAGKLKLPGNLDAHSGFLDGIRTPILDAVELLDIHLPLGKKMDK